ncbi:MAG: type II secretion system protein [Verrucomicrobiota bacterium]
MKRLPAPRTRRRVAGFTLIEPLVVIATIAIPPACCCRP